MHGEGYAIMSFPWRLATLLGALTELVFGVVIDGVQIQIGHELKARPSMPTGCEDDHEELMMKGQSSVGG